MPFTVTDRNDPDCADLHVHSHYSDADPHLSPDELCRQAAEAGIKHLGLTDHDTAPDLELCRALSQKHGVDLIHGCELSNYHQNRFGELVPVHIGVLWPDLNNAAFRQILAYNQSQDFHGRVLAMFHKAKKAGYDPYGMGPERNAEAAIASNPKSVHYGKRIVVPRLVESGCFPDRRAAYDFLARGGDGYVPVTEHLHFPRVEEAAPALTSHAMTTLNHLWYSGMDDIDNRALLLLAKKLGIQALEVFYSPYTPEQQAILMAACKELNFFPNMGSDKHDDSRDFIYGPGEAFQDLKWRQLALHGTLNQ